MLKEYRDISKIIENIEIKMVASLKITCTERRTGKIISEVKNESVYLNETNAVYTLLIIDSGEDLHDHSG